MATEKCYTKCISAGQSLAREHDSFRALCKTPIIYQENLRGLISVDDLQIPHSELAMHTKAAGKEILAFFCTRQMGFVAYKDDECCGFTFGRIDELLSPPLRRKVKEMWGPSED